MATSSTTAPSRDRSSLNDADLSSEALAKEGALALAERLWTAAAASRTPKERALDAERSRMVHDARGKETVTALLDRAFRSPSDVVTATQVAKLLKRRGIPGFFRPLERFGLSVAVLVAPVLPWLVVPAIKAVMRRKTAEVILPGEPAALTRHIRARSASGVRLNLNHLGEMILGEDEAAEKIREDIVLLANPDIDCISVKASNLYSQIAPIAHERSVGVLIERLRPLLRAAMSNRNRHDAYKLVNIDMEEYRDLAITVEAYQHVLDEPEFLSLQVGIAMQAYIPDTYGVVERLLLWAKERVARGGAPIRIRVVKGANRAMELVDSSVRGIPVPTYDDKTDTDANWKAIIELISRPEHIKVCHLGIASHNIFDIAWASMLVKERKVNHFCVFEMLEGMANHVQRQVREQIGDVLLYAPAVAPGKFLTAIAYLVRRFDELTDPNNFLSHAFGVQLGSAAWKVQAANFMESVRRMATVSHVRKRQQNRLTETVVAAPVPSLEAFRNEPDTDWTAAANREWLTEHVLAKRDAMRANPETLSLSDAVRGPSQNVLGISSMTNAALPNNASTVDGIDSPKGEMPGYLEMKKETARPSGSSTTPRNDRTIVDETDRSEPSVIFARTELASKEDALRMLETAATSAAAWTDLAPEQRDAILAEVVAELQRKRADLIAYAAADVGKTFDQADPEISEAIDFGRLYPLAVRHFRETLPHLTMKPLGNGVVMVISPWNFPIAIPAGGIFAALAAGNRVILKPSSESRVITSKVAECFWAAGVPRAALQVLVCHNEVAAMVAADPRVDGIVLTGSTATADRILAARPGVALFAETGGKDCTIITGNADRELAVKHIADSLRNNGQKCSATSLVLATPDVYGDPEFWRQLRDAVASLPVGSAWDPASVITPLFRTPGVELMRGLTTLEPGEEWLLEPKRVDGREDFWTPGVKKGVQRGSFTHLTELFGPVIGVMPVADLDDALDAIHETGRGLTLGIESLDDDEVAYVADRAKVGVIYVRKSTVGAVANRQTFGGFADSRRGPGLHAGSINYVTNFMTFEEDAAVSTGGAGIHRAWQTFFSKEHRPAQDIRGEDNIHRYRPLGKVVIRVTDADSATSIVVRVAAAKIAGNEVEVSAQATETAQELAARVIAGGIAMIRYARPEAAEPAVLAAAAKHPRTYISRAAVVMNGRIELLRYLQEQTISDSYHRYGGNLREKDSR